MFIEKNYTGLYIHVPFCVKKCSYCSFYSIECDEMLLTRFRSTLLAELERKTAGINIGTVYAGGGTPTVLPPEFWSEFLSTLDDVADTSDVLEMTIETNPGAVLPGVLAEFRKAGFNRLSIGIQSFISGELKTLGRIHSPDQAIITFNQARDTGFQNIGIDLMYGIPGQIPDNWQSNLKKAVELSPEHISCYELSIEKGTPIADLINNGELSKPSEEHCREMYFLADEYLKEAGYIHYEVSNYAKGDENISRHNSSYWNRTPYIGLGPSAHSFDGKRIRSWNVCELNEYLSLIEHDRSPVEETEELDSQEIAIEMLMLGLRWQAGADIDEIEATTGFRINEQYLDRMVRSGRVQVSGSRILPTAEGMLFADGDAANLIEDFSKDV
jgi:oxygen-independent coproporphyrinogen-3 oxidase